MLGKDFLPAVRSRMLGKRNGGRFAMYHREGGIGRLCNCADSRVVEERFRLALLCVAFLPGLSRALGWRNCGMGGSEGLTDRRREPFLPAYVTKWMMADRGWARVTQKNESSTDYSRLI